MPLDLARQVVVRWPDPDPRHIPLLRQGGIEAVLLETPNEAFERACAAANIVAAPSSSAAQVSQHGLWPGIRGAPNVKGRGDETASASRDPWLDANGFLVAYHRALHPERPAVLGYLPNEAAGLAKDRMVPFTTLEIALAEARIAGGNYLLALEDRYSTALFAGEAKAIDAWKRLGTTAAWLQKMRPYFGLPVAPTITMLVEEGDATEELANLAYRRNACPALAPASNPPRPAPARILCLCAASIKPPSAAIRARILAHAESGATVVVDEPGEKAWWRDARLKHTKDEGDRDIFALGKGRVIAYRDTVLDPSEFALDLIDFVGHKMRTARHWNANTVVIIPTAGRKAGESLLHIVNYGSPIDRDIQVRLQGHFSAVRLERPEAASVSLKPAKRGTATEVQVPELGCAATLVFS
jgi:hypothetical protein